MLSSPMVSSWEAQPPQWELLCNFAKTRVNFPYLPSLKLQCPARRLCQFPHWIAQGYGKITTGVLSVIVYGNTGEPQAGIGLANPSLLPETSINIPVKISSYTIPYHALLEDCCVALALPAFFTPLGASIRAREIGTGCARLVH